ncbi:HNH endonuclease signature motif containing protein [Streptomyces sp. NPDC001705]
MSLQDAVRYFTWVNLRFVGCWEWRGSPSQKYPAFKVAGEARKVHRIAYELAYGRIPPTWVVLHRCDNTRCVRPDHLRVGSQRDNVLDMHIKGRHRNQNSGRLLCRRGHLDWISVPGGRKCRSCRNLRQRERRRADPQ